MSELTDDYLEQFYKICEKRVSNNPLEYKLELIIFIIYGYAYIAFLTLAIALLAIVMFVGLIVNPLTLLFEFLLIPLLWIILKNIIIMFRRLPPPRYAVKLRENSPIVRLADTLCGEMKMKRIDSVCLTAEVNASAGFYKGKTIVRIGAPLLAALNVRQLKTLLAHELAHIRLRHNLIGRFIGYSELYWNRLLFDMREKTFSGIGASVIAKFYFRFINILNIKSKALDRYNELLADSAAAKITDGISFAETVSLINILEYAINAYDIWGAYFREAMDNESPADLFDFIKKELGKVSGEETALYYNARMHLKPVPADDHPCMRARLEKLGAYPEKLRFPDSGAAAELLSGEDKSLWDRLFSLWQQRWWNHARKVLLNAKTELSEKIDISRELRSAAEEMMPLLFSIMPRRQFTALSESNLTVNPYSAYSLFAVGAAKLFGGDRSGLEMLKFAYNKNESLCLEIRRAIKFYFLHFCSEAELKQFAAENAKLFANERGAVLSTGELLTPTDIEHRHKVPFVWASVITIRNDGLVSKIREIAAGSPLLRGAYMILETERCVLIIRYNRGWRKSECDEERLRFIETARSEVLLATGLPLYVFTESQVAPTRRLKRCYRNYAHKIK